MSELSQIVPQHFTFNLVAYRLLNQKTTSKMQELNFNQEQSNVPSVHIYDSAHRGNVTTSRNIAEVFGKSHRHVLRDIRNLACSDEFRESNFGQMYSIRSLHNNAEAKDPYYEVTKDGFTFLVMGYTGEKAAKFKEEYIKAFNQREALLNSEEYILTKAFSIMQNKTIQLEEENRRKQERIELQSQVIKEQAPKVEYHDEVLSSNSSHTTTTIAKELGMTAIALNKLLHELKVQFKQDNVWVLYSKYQNRDFTKTTTFTYTDNNGKTSTRISTEWTEKGRKFIHELLKKQQSA